MPGYLLAAYIDMMPRLQAEDDLRRIVVTAVGAGNMKKNESQRIINILQRQANAGKSKPKLDKKQAAVVLSTMGIALGNEKRKKKNG